MCVDVIGNKSNEKKPPEIERNLCETKLKGKREGVPELLTVVQERKNYREGRTMLRVVQERKRNRKGRDTSKGGVDKFRYREREREKI